MACHHLLICGRKRNMEDHSNSTRHCSNFFAPMRQATQLRRAINLEGGWNYKSNNNPASCVLMGYIFAGIKFRGFRPNPRKSAKFNTFENSHRSHPIYCPSRGGVRQIFAEGMLIWWVPKCTVCKFFPWVCKFFPLCILIRNLHFLLVYRCIIYFTPLR